MTQNYNQTFIYEILPELKLAKYKSSMQDTRVELGREGEELFQSVCE